MTNLRRIVILLAGLLAGAGLAIGLTDFNPAVAQVDPAPASNTPPADTPSQTQALLDPDAPPRPGPQDRAAFLAASFAEHLWIARPQGNRFNLLHYNRQIMTDQTMRAALSEVQAQVVGVVSLGDSAVLIYRDNSAQAVEFTGEPDMQGSRYAVAQRVSLPRGAVVIDAATFDRTPVVLVETSVAASQPDGDTRQEPTAAADASAAPAPQDEADTTAVNSTTSPDDHAAEHASLQLLQLRAGQWRPIGLPRSLGASDQVQLAALNGSSVPQLLLILTDEAEDRVTVWSGRRDEQWTSQDHDLPDATAWRFIGVGRHLVAVRPDETGTGFQARALLADRQVDLGAFEAGDRAIAHWQPLSWSDHLLLLSVDEQGNFAWAQRDLAAPPDQPTAFTDLPVKDWPLVEWNAHMVMMLLMLIAFPLIMLLSLRRPPQANLVMLPEGMQATPLGRRFAAAAIDFAPALLVAMIATGIADPMQVLRNWPSLHTQWDAPQAGLYAIALFVGSTCIAELISGSTLGKRIMRCRVVDNRGGQAKRGQVLIRNAMKVMELLAFLLLILPLLSRHRQRLGDLVARTVVVDTAGHPEASKEGSDDQAAESSDPIKPDDPEARR